MEVYRENEYYDVSGNDAGPRTGTGPSSDPYFETRLRRYGRVRFDTVQDAYRTGSDYEPSVAAVASESGRGETDKSTGTDELVHLSAACQPRSSDVGDVAVSLDNGKNREYRWKNVVWIKDVLIFPSRNGLERSSFCRVQYRRKNSSMSYDLYTYAEGIRGNRGPVERDFKYLCGEIVSSEPLSSVGKLKNVFTCVDVEDETDATSKDPSLTTSGPQTDGSLLTRRLHTVPLEVDRSNLVLVFRTYNDTLALQLLPTVYTRWPLTPGQPLFTHTNRDVVGAVGNRYSEFSYVINGAPNSYALFKVPPSTGGDRMYVILIDRRQYADSKSSRQDDAGYAVPTYVKRAVESAYNGGGLSRDGLSDVQGYDDYGRKRSAYKFDVDDVLYLGVVNATLQVTDVLSNSKRSKSPKNAVVIFIDRVGITAVAVDESVPKSYWAHREDNAVYSVASRDFWHKGKDEVIIVNTESKLRRVKSQEYLI